MIFLTDENRWTVLFYVIQQIPFIDPLHEDKRELFVLYEAVSRNDVNRFGLTDDFAGQIILVMFNFHERIFLKICNETITVAPEEKQI